MFDLYSLQKKAEKFAYKIENKLSELFEDHEKTKENVQANTQKIDCLMKYVHCTNKAIYSDQDQINQAKLCGEFLENDCQI